MNAQRGVSAELAEILKRNGYSVFRRLDNGEVAGISQFIYTFGLVLGLDETGYRTRFCYPDFASALQALLIWDGFGDPPGPWIKEKGRIERMRPNIGGIPVNVERVKNP